MKLTREDKPYILMIGGCFAAIALLLCIPFLGYARHLGHPGHYDRVWVEGGTKVQPILMSNGTTGTTIQYVPEHFKRVWVCEKCGK